MDDMRVTAQILADAARRCGTSAADAAEQIGKMNSGNCGAKTERLQAPIVYCVHPITGENCCVRRGQKGYRKISPRADVASMNRELGVEPWQETAAVIALEKEYGL